MSREAKVAVSQHGKRFHRKRTLIAYSFILPNFLGFLILTMFPILFSFFLSLCDWNAGNDFKFVGFQNFVELFTTDYVFPTALGNTVYYTVAVVPVTLLLSLLLAMLMNSKIKGRVFFRSVLFFPYVASIIAIATVWMALFNPDRGPINEMLRAIGVANPPRWTASTVWAMPTIIGLTIWKGVGYYMIVYLAALQGVPAELYEAAKIDGANPVQRFFKVTWPMVTPTTFYVLMMLIVSTFKSYDIMYVTTQGGPGISTQVLCYHIYNKAFVSQRFGYASAIAMILFVIILIITLIQFRVEKRFTDYL